MLSLVVPFMIWHWLASSKPVGRGALVVLKELLKVGRVFVGPYHNANG